MKTLVKLFTGLFIICVAQVSMSQITGSAHDFSGQSWNTTGEICIVCHTPHNADITVGNVPLWNHEISVATYTPYTSNTLDATVGQPTGGSKLCLSCHDGTVALESFSGNPGGNHFITGNNLIGTDLADDHPISFDYDGPLATADPGLFDPTTTPSGLGGTISATMLFAGKMQCASCHDVHNSAGIDYLLRKSNNASSLCLTCHDK